ncbi:hypothetical protein HY993_03740, partial [Candidatus Micrarchaeota archaeon]|nr:hypothetical protein [Candidatus Micrarchaeota archaeon]
AEGQNVVIPAQTQFELNALEGDEGAENNQFVLPASVTFLLPANARVSDSSATLAAQLPTGELISLSGETTSGERTATGELKVTAGGNSVLYAPSSIASPIAGGGYYLSLPFPYYINALESQVSGLKIVLDEYEIALPQSASQVKLSSSELSTLSLATEPKTALFLAETPAQPGEMLSFLINANERVAFSPIAPISLSNTVSVSVPFDFEALAKPSDRVSAREGAAGISTPKGVAFFSSASLDSVSGARIINVGKNTQFFVSQGLVKAIEGGWSIALPSDARLSFPPATAFAQLSGKYVVSANGFTVSLPAGSAPVSTPTQAYALVRAGNAFEVTASENFVVGVNVVLPLALQAGIPSNVLATQQSSAVLLDFGNGKKAFFSQASLSSGKLSVAAGSSAQFSTALAQVTDNSRSYRLALPIAYSLSVSENDVVSDDGFSVFSSGYKITSQSPVGGNSITVSPNANAVFSYGTGLEIDGNTVLESPFALELIVPQSTGVKQLDSNIAIQSGFGLIVLSQSASSGERQSDGSTKYVISPNSKFSVPSSVGSKTQYGFSLQMPFESSVVASDAQVEYFGGEYIISRGDVELVVPASASVESGGDGNVLVPPGARMLLRPSAFKDFGNGVPVSVPAQIDFSLPPNVRKTDSGTFTAVFNDGGRLTFPQSPDSAGVVSVGENQVFFASPQYARPLKNSGWSLSMPVLMKIFVSDADVSSIGGRYVLTTQSFRLTTRSAPRQERNQLVVSVPAGQSALFEPNEEANSFFGPSFSIPFDYTVILPSSAQVDSSSGVTVSFSFGQKINFQNAQFEKNPRRVLVQKNSLGKATAPLVYPINYDFTNLQQYASYALALPAFTEINLYPQEKVYSNPDGTRSFFPEGVSSNYVDLRAPYQNSFEWKASNALEVIMPSGASSRPFISGVSAGKVAWSIPMFSRVSVAPALTSRTKGEPYAMPVDLEATLPSFVKVLPPTDSTTLVADKKQLTVFDASAVLTTGTGPNKLVIPAGVLVAFGDFAFDLTSSRAQENPETITPYSFRAALPFEVTIKAPSSAKVTVSGNGYSILTDSDEVILSNARAVEDKAAAGSSSKATEAAKAKKFNGKELLTARKFVVPADAFIEFRPIDKSLLEEAGDIRESTIEVIVPPYVNFVLNLPRRAKIITTYSNSEGDGDGEGFLDDEKSFDDAIGIVDVNGKRFGFDSNVDLENSDLSNLVIPATAKILVPKAYAKITVVPSALDGPPLTYLEDSNVTIKYGFTLKLPFNYEAHYFAKTYEDSRNRWHTTPGAIVLGDETKDGSGATESGSSTANGDLGFKLGASGAKAAAVNQFKSQCDTPSTFSNCDYSSILTEAKSSRPTVLTGDPNKLLMAFPGNPVKFSFQPPSVNRFSLISVHGGKADGKQLCGGGNVDVFKLPIPIKSVLDVQGGRPGMLPECGNAIIYDNPSRARVLREGSTVPLYTLPMHGAVCASNKISASNQLAPLPANTELTVFVCSDSPEDEKTLKIGLEKASTFVIPLNSKISPDFKNIDFQKCRDVQVSTLGFDAPLPQSHKIKFTPDSDKRIITPDPAVEGSIRLNVPEGSLDLYFIPACLARGNSVSKASNLENVFVYVTKQVKDKDGNVVDSIDLNPSAPQGQQPNGAPAANAQATAVEGKQGGGEKASNSLDIELTDQKTSGSAEICVYQDTDTTKTLRVSTSEPNEADARNIAGAAIGEAFPYIEWGFDGTNQKERLLQKAAPRIEKKCARTYSVKARLPADYKFTDVCSFNEEEFSTVLPFKIEGENWVGYKQGERTVSVNVKVKVKPTSSACKISPPSAVHNGFSVTNSPKFAGEGATQPLAFKGVDSSKTTINELPSNKVPSGVNFHRQYFIASNNALKPVKIALIQLPPGVECSYVKDGRMQKVDESTKFGLAGSEAVLFECKSVGVKTAAKAGKAVQAPLELSVVSLAADNAGAGVQSGSVTGLPAVVSGGPIVSAPSALGETLTPSAAASADGITQVEGGLNGKIIITYVNEDDAKKPMQNAEIPVVLFEPSKQAEGLYSSSPIGVRAQGTLSSGSCRDEFCDTKQIPDVTALWTIEQAAEVARLLSSGPDFQQSLVKLQEDGFARTIILRKAGDLEELGLGNIAAFGQSKLNSQEDFSKMKVSVTQGGGELKGCGLFAVTYRLNDKAFSDAGVVDKKSFFAKAQFELSAVKLADCPVTLSNAPVLFSSDKSQVGVTIGQDIVVWPAEFGKGWKRALENKHPLGMFKFGPYDNDPDGNEQDLAAATLLYEAVYGDVSDEKGDAKKATIPTPFNDRNFCSSRAVSQIGTVVAASAGSALLISVGGLALSLTVGGLGFGAAMEAVAAKLFTWATKTGINAGFGLVGCGASLAATGIKGNACLGWNLCVYEAFGVGGASLLPGKSGGVAGIKGLLPNLKAEVLHAVGPVEKVVGGTLVRNTGGVARAVFKRGATTALVSGLGGFAYAIFSPEKDNAAVPLLAGLSHNSRELAARNSFVRNQFIKDLLAKQESMTDDEFKAFLNLVESRQKGAIGGAVGEFVESNFKTNPALALISLDATESNALPKALLSPEVADDEIKAIGKAMADKSTDFSKALAGIDDAQHANLWNALVKIHSKDASKLDGILNDPAIRPHLSLTTLNRPDLNTFAKAIEQGNSFEFNTNDVKLLSSRIPPSDLIDAIDDPKALRAVLSSMPDVTLKQSLDSLEPSLLKKIAANTGKDELIAAVLKARNLPGAKSAADGVVNSLSTNSKTAFEGAAEELAGIKSAVGGFKTAPALVKEIKAAASINELKALLSSNDPALVQKALKQMGRKDFASALTKLGATPASVGAAAGALGIDDLIKAAGGAADDAAFASGIDALFTELETKPGLRARLSGGVKTKLSKVGGGLSQLSGGKLAGIVTSAIAYSIGILFDVDVRPVEAAVTPQIDNHFVSYHLVPSKRLSAVTPTIRRVCVQKPLEKGQSEKDYDCLEDETFYLGNLCDSDTNACLYLRPVSRAGKQPGFVLISAFNDYDLQDDNGLSAQVIASVFDPVKAPVELSGSYKSGVIDEKLIGKLKLRDPDEGDDQGKKTVFSKARKEQEAKNSPQSAGPVLGGGTK